jgi:hypothetical protein
VKRSVRGSESEVVESDKSQTPVRERVGYLSECFCSLRLVIYVASELQRPLQLAIRIPPRMDRLTVHIC